jgi:hypothetical protein
MATEGQMGVRAIARELGKSPGYICKVLKKLRLGPGDQLPIVKASGRLNKKIDLLEQLSNRHSILQRDLKYLEKRKGEVPETSRSLVEDRVLKAMGELRKIEGLYLEIAKTVYELIEHATFRRIVIQEIKSESFECAKRIQLRFDQVLASRGLEGIDQFGN